MRKCVHLSTMQYLRVCARGLARVLMEANRTRTHKPAINLRVCATTCIQARSSLQGNMAVDLCSRVLGRVLLWGETPIPSEVVHDACAQGPATGPLLFSSAAHIRKQNHAQCETVTVCEGGWSFWPCWRQACLLGMSCCQQSTSADAYLLRLFTATVSSLLPVSWKAVHKHTFLGNTGDQVSKHFLLSDTHTYFAS